MIKFNKEDVVDSWNRKAFPEDKEEILANIGLSKELIEKYEKIDFEYLPKYIQKEVLKIYRKDFKEHNV